MSTINAIADINYDTWTINGLDSLTTDIELSFSAQSIVDGDNNYVEFNRFKYGFFLRDVDGATVQYGSYPQVGQNLTSTDCESLSIVSLNVEPDTTYKLQVWAEDAGIFYESIVDVVVPKTEIPSDPSGEFTSWSWDSGTKQWVPPVEKPTDPEDESGFYKWNEGSHQWELINIVPIEE